MFDKRVLLDPEFPVPKMKIQIDEAPPIPHQGESLVVYKILLIPQFIHLPRLLVEFDIEKEFSNYTELAQLLKNQLSL